MLQRLKFMPTFSIGILVEQFNERRFNSKFECNTIHLSNIVEVKPLGYNIPKGF